MFWLLLIVAIIAALVLIALKGKSKIAEVWPFYPKKPLSPPEQILYFRLVKALPQHIVLAQVQLSRFLGVKKGNNHQSWLNRINRMSADYVICGKDAKVLAVIELDDASHQSEKRKVTDLKKDKAIESAGLTIYRWNVKSIPDESTIQNLLLQSVSASTHVG